MLSNYALADCGKWKDCRSCVSNHPCNFIWNSSSCVGVDEEIPPGSTFTPEDSEDWCPAKPTPKPTPNQSTTSFYMVGFWILLCVLLIFGGKKYIAHSYNLLYSFNYSCYMKGVKMRTWITAARRARPRTPENIPLV